ncbi:MAG: class I SAM-dependent methyltransferase [Candidatus Nanohaloarchaea archaeon]
MKLRRKISNRLGGHYSDLRDRFILSHDFHAEKVLDIGCDNGRVIRKLSDEIDEAYGFDFDCTEPDDDNIYFEEADATEKFPYEEDKFDSIICREVLEHVTDPYNLLKESRRVLKPEGRILITTPNIDNLVYRIKGAEPADGHIFELKKTQLQHLVQQFYEVEKHELGPFPFNYVQFLKAFPKTQNLEPALKNNR